MYCTTNDIKAAANDSNDNLLWVTAQIIKAISDSIDMYCNRLDGFVADETATSREYAAGGLFFLYVDDCVQIDTVEVKDGGPDGDYETWDATEYRAFAGSFRRPNFQPQGRNQPIPYTGIMTTAQARRSTFPNGSESFQFGRGLQVGGDRYHANYSRFRPTVRISARWGFAERVPNIIRQATINEVLRLRQRLKGGLPAGEIGGGETGGILYEGELDVSTKHLLNRSGMVRARL